MLGYTFLKCPFCGNDPRKTYTGEGIKVMEQGGLVWCECTRCGAAGPKVKVPDGSASDHKIILASGKWNCRQWERKQLAADLRALESKRHEFTRDITSGNHKQNNRARRLNNG